MTRKFKTKLLVAALAAVPMAAMPAATAVAQQVVRPSQDIVLSIGKGELVTVPGAMTDVFVANDSVAAPALRVRQGRRRDHGLRQQ